MRIMFAAMALMIASQSFAAPAKKAVARKAPKSVAAPASVAKTLPVFEFRGERTDVTVDTSAKRGCDKGDTDGKLACYTTTAVAGVENMTIGQSYYRGKLYYVGGIFKEDNYLTVLQAFTAKYGAPNLATKKWQSKGGATFDNNVATWLFSMGGKLELESMGGKVGESGFSFLAQDNAPPSLAPKVDF